MKIESRAATRAVALAGVLLLFRALPLGAQPQSPAEPPAAPPGMLDPRAPVKPLDEALHEVRASRMAAPALERYEAGDYRAAARLGLQTIAAGGDTPELRYAVANSLAWTGRYDAALEQYQALRGTAYDSRASIGIANIRLWNGEPQLAEERFREVLASDPSNADARRGLELAGRELRPALTLRLARTEDNQNFARDEAWLTYRKWSADRAWRFEASALRDWYSSPGTDTTRNSLHGSVWAMALPLAPRLEASAYDNRLFATLQVEPMRDVVRLRAGHVNWARLAFSAGALADGLTANTVGLSADARPALGALRLRLDGYEISDGNRIVDGEFQFTPAWQPLPWRLEWYGGVYGRRAERSDARYWSPTPAYGLAFLGVRRNWSADRHDVSAWLRAGAGFTETAKASWSAGLTGRYWIANDIALGLEAWALEAPRPSPYHMQQAMAFVQHLW
jgi:tetratricopeptide (TPR) repeat protein